MTDKEPIIINSVDVSECYYYCSSNCKGCYLIEQDKIKLYGKCEEINDCHYKQLTRKTQECEELKNQVLDMHRRLITLDEEAITVQITEDEFKEYKDLRDQLAEVGKKVEVYKQALEEIEEFCNLRKLNPVYALVAIKILDIINKAKGEMNG